MKSQRAIEECVNAYDNLSIASSRVKAAEIELREAQRIYVLALTELERVEQRYYQPWPI